MSPIPTTSAELLEAVVRSGLLPEKMLRPFAAEPEGPERERALANRLIREGLLTPYQGRQLLAGKTHGFFLGEKFKILGLIGTGGMGHVYLGEHLVLQRLVAIKVLQNSAAESASGGAEAAFERFLREARAVAALDHPNIVRVHDMERAGSIPFMVMEYVDGSSLHQIVSGFGALSVPRAASYIAQAAAGLQHAHDNGLLHRDIKPGNLLLDRAGTIKLLDLGLARFFGDSARNDNLTARFNDDEAVVGTADYMSPEQALNDSTLDIRSDLYSLGATFYFLLAGQAPFEGDSLPQKLMAHQFRQPKAIQSFRKDVPGGLIDVVLRMMAKNRDDRFRFPSEVVGALTPWTRVGPPVPAAAEMPKMPPSAYRLGLIAGPGGAARGRGSWDIPPAPSGADDRGDTPHAALDSTAYGARRDAPEPTAPLPGDPSNSPAERPPLTRRSILLAGGAAAAILGTAGVWWQQTKRERRPGGEPGPTPVPPATNITLTGSGSTFIKLAMAQWAGLYEKQTGVKIKYDGIGSGRGVANMIDKVLDFGCTDAAMTDALLAKARAAGGEVVHIPLALGAVVATYNLPDVPAQLHITGPVIADVFLGKIAKWNHPALAASNPGVTLPNLDITVIHRSEDSGTTFIWTDFLKKSSAEWEAKVGAATTVKWPVGEEAEKNDGIANAVSRKVGSLGYVELSFALERNLKFARIKNQSQFVEASLESVTAAADASLQTIPPDLRFTLTNALGDDSYPIAGSSWAVLYVRQTGPKGKELWRFLRWAIHEGQAILKDLRYSPLPARLVARIDQKLAAIEV